VFKVLKDWGGMEVEEFEVEEDSGSN